MKSYTREQIDSYLLKLGWNDQDRESFFDVLDTPEPEKSFVEKYRGWYDYLATTPNLTRKEIFEGYAHLIEEMVDRKINALEVKVNAIGISNAAAHAAINNYVKKGYPS